MEKIREDQGKEEFNWQDVREILAGIREDQKQQAEDIKQIIATQKQTNIKIENK